MSYTETHFGKIRILTKNTKDTIQYIKDNNLSKYYNITNKNDIHLTDENDKTHMLIDNNNEYIMLEFINHTKIDDGNDFFRLMPNDDNTYTFATQFYNGGCCLYELMENYVNEMLNN